MKICGNGAFTENFLTRKLGEISALNAVQELHFSKLVRLLPATILEIELHRFFHCFSAELYKAYFEHFSIAVAETCQCNKCSDIKINFTFFT